MGGVLLVVPAYNEEESIRAVAARLTESPYDYLIVNDGSTDRTPQILDEINAPHIDLVENLGIGGAVQTGYIYALSHGYDVAVQFDGDGQHDVSYVEDIVSPLADGVADICVGSRFVGDESEFRSSRVRRMGISLLSASLKASTGQTIRDVTSGFRAVNRRALALFVRSYPSDYPEPESLAFSLSHGLAVKEVPVRMHEREGGSSSINGLKSCYYMLKVGLSIFVFGRRKGTR
ncbi:glycosyltransferase family 2 protein [Adlercreutzia aquisgranensis]|uniref:glycosyltransferase family 2 protein n=1 Tax=Adlercreutzia aquisgranensis TaxID=2941323 RepID=UPI00203D2E7C|nr:glycosyltransferase family 2 protein [Adlercreutzia aquisgranensis]